VSIADFYNAAMTVKHVAASRDAAGGVTETTTTRYRDVLCRIRQLSQDERGGLGRELVPSTHRVYCDPATPITTTDLLVIGSDTYNVYRVNDPHGLGHHLEIDVALTE